MPTKTVARNADDFLSLARPFGGKSTRSDALLEEVQGLQRILETIAELNSGRKVRPVVTPSGKRARGAFPSIKAPKRARYESLLEQAVLRALEVCPRVRVVHTHPCVLALPGQPLIHYTPDVQVEGLDEGFLVETKATFFLKEPRARARLREVVQRLRAHRILVVLITELDIRDSFQEELKELLRLRPVVGRYRPRLVTSAWDPLQRTVADFALERRWRDAKSECDALLERVMRRDPDELLGAVVR